MPMIRLLLDQFNYSEGLFRISALHNCSARIMEAKSLFHMEFLECKLKIFEVQVCLNNFHMSAANKFYVAAVILAIRNEFRTFSVLVHTA
jgi:hypothetical protein